MPVMSEMKTETASRLRPNGAAAAMVLSAGIGGAIYGVAIVLATISAGIKNLLSWWDPAGPLTGKTGVGVIAWLVAWAILHWIWKDRELAFRRVWIATLVLLVIAFALSFPPVYDAFAPH